MRTRDLEVPAPGDLGVELLGVPEGSPVELRLRFEAVMEGVLVSGTALAQVAGECARCLEPLEDAIEVSLQELYVYPESDAEEGEASRLEGELLDLEPVLRDAVVLALPFQPVCQPDCQGLCLECGVRLNDHPGHTHHNGVDPRWALLSGLLPNDAGEIAGEDEE
ncbi:MAG: YceD family protein [Nocardioidaceae bacterium]